MNVVLRTSFVFTSHRGVVGIIYNLPETVASDVTQAVYADTQGSKTVFYGKFYEANVNPILALEEALPLTIEALRAQVTL